MKYLYLLLLTLPAPTLFAQSLPIIKATSKTVSIRDGDYLDKNAWNLSPKARPDIFTADRTRQPKWVTFYTDIDSIRVKVKPGTKYDFIILLNGKDSCYTQIASAIGPEAGATASDTIPFTLTEYNAIAIRTVVNDTDTINFHFDASSFGFHLTRDALTRNPRLKKVTRLQMGTLVWNNPPITPTGFTAHDMDGRLGWDVFEGKRVEIDYDHNRLIVSSRLPDHLKGYVRLSLGFVRSFPFIKGRFAVDNKEYTGDFLLDTGSEQSIILDSAWASLQQFPARLRLIRSTVLKDPRGVKYETKVVLAPLFRIDHFELKEIPTLVLGSKNPTGLVVNLLGNDLLKRFNMILDFQKDRVYLKPNGLVNVAYRSNS